MSASLRPGRVCTACARWAPHHGKGLCWPCYRAQYVRPPGPHAALAARPRPPVVPDGPVICPACGTRFVAPIVAAPTAGRPGTA